MRRLGAVGGQCFVMEGLRRLGVERQGELIAPAELEARFRKSVVA